MPSRGSSGIAAYMAWNTSSNAYQTGDAGNHTLRFLKDGVETTPTNSPSEVDSTNAPGAYAIAWTSTEGTCNILWIGGKSATANVYLVPITIGFELLPTFAPGTNQGLITAGSGFGQLTTFSGAASSNVTQWLQIAPVALQNGLVAVAVASGAVTGVNGNVNGSVNSVISTVSANLTQWEGVSPNALQNGLVAVAVASGAVTGVTGSVASVTSGVNVTQWLAVTVASTISGGLIQASVTSGAGSSNVNVISWGGTSVTATPPDVIFTTAGTAQAGGSNTITLASGTIGQDNIFQNETIIINFGSGRNEAANIATYTAATKVATIVGTWAVNPASGSGYTIVGLGPVAATVGGTVNANVIQVGGTNITAASGFLQTNTTQIQGIAPTIEADGRLTVAVVSGLVNANLTQWEGAAPLALNAAGQVLVATVSGAATSVGNTAIGNVAGNVLGSVNSVVTTVNANVTQAGGTSVTATSGFLQVNTVQAGGIAPTIEADGHFTVAVVSGLVNANITQALGAAVVANSGFLQTNSVQLVGIAPTMEADGHFLAAVVSGVVAAVGAPGTTLGNVAGNVQGSVGSVTTQISANVLQWSGVNVNALISGRVDSIANQIGPNTIATATFQPAALTTTVFAAGYLTSALADSTFYNANADGLLDRSNAIETGLTPRQSWRLDAAALGGQLSGAGTQAIGIWGAGVTTTRISATTTFSGNRSSVTLNL